LLLFSSLENWGEKKPTTIRCVIPPPSLGFPRPLDDNEDDRTEMNEDDRTEMNEDDRTEMNEDDRTEMNEDDTVMNEDDRTEMNEDGSMEVTEDEIKLEIEEDGVEAADNICDTCGLNFSSNVNLKKHVERKHNQDALVCQHCPRVFENRDKLRCHEHSHYSGTCPHCSKSISKKNLSTHLKICKLNPDNMGENKGSLFKYARLNELVSLFTCNYMFTLLMK
jgi:hypothetical protein